MSDQDARTPPHYKPGQFIKYNGRLLKVAFAFFLASEPDRWQLFLEPRESVVETERDWYCYDLETLSRIFPSPIASLKIVRWLYKLSGCYWRVDPFGSLELVDDSVLVRDKAEIVSSGAVLGKSRGSNDWWKNL